MKQTKKIKRSTADVPYKVYSDLASDYNKIVDQYNELADDSSAILAFLRDVGRGLAVFAFDTMIVPPQVHNMQPITALSVVDPEREFAVDMYNELAKFVTTVQEGTRPKEAYVAWIEECKKIAKGGIIV